jgi:hypothetical protein
MIAQVIDVLGACCISILLALGNILSHSSGYECR